MVSHDNEQSRKRNLDNLPLIFAVGVAIGMAKKEKEVAALAAMISFFVMHVSINAMLVLRGDILADGSLADHVLGGTVAQMCAGSRRFRWVFSAESSWDSALRLCTTGSIRSSCQMRFHFSEGQDLCRSFPRSHMLW